MTEKYTYKEDKGNHWIAINGELAFKIGDYGMTLHVCRELNEQAAEIDHLKKRQNYYKQRESRLIDEHNKANQLAAKLEDLEESLRWRKWPEEVPPPNQKRYVLDMYIVTRECFYNKKREVHTSVAWWAKDEEEGTGRWLWCTREEQTEIDNIIAWLPLPIPSSSRCQEDDKEVGECDTCVHGYSQEFNYTSGPPTQECKEKLEPDTCNSYKPKKMESE